MVDECRDLAGGVDAHELAAALDEAARPMRGLVDVDRSRSTIQTLPQNFGATSRARRHSDLHHPCEPRSVRGEASQL